MRVHETDARPGVCWLDFSIGGTGIPNHIVAVITAWSEIPENFQRTTFVYDSVLFGGKGKATQKWREPPDLAKRRRSTQGT
jgi:hypothetical protein